MWYRRERVSGKKSRRYTPARLERQGACTDVPCGCAAQSGRAARREASWEGRARGSVQGRVLLLLALQRLLLVLQLLIQ